MFYFVRDGAWICWYYVDYNVELAVLLFKNVTRIQEERWQTLFRKQESKE